METQKSIHLKINEELLEVLDEYAKSSYLSRNRIINWAIQDYLDQKRPGRFKGYIRGYTRNNPV